MPRGKPDPELEKVRETLRLYFDLKRTLGEQGEELIQLLIARWAREDEQQEE